jgi:predicted enzyme related to lactoylglutathione lyase
MLRGLSTVSFYAADHAAAKRWYTELFGEPPYFDRPGYFEFRIGDHQHEFGVIDSAYAGHDVTTSPAGEIVFWHVDDLEASLKRLLDAGATPLDGMRERGEGFVTASVTDPFGNILGIMYNPHYLEMLER